MNFEKEAESRGRERSYTLCRVYERLHVAMEQQQQQQQNLANLTFLWQGKINSFRKVLGFKLDF
jgi:hypothetical protein